jgi:hypothetical protein
MAFSSRLVEPWGRLAASARSVFTSAVRAAVNSSVNRIADTALRTASSISLADL